MIFKTKITYILFSLAATTLMSCSKVTDWDKFGVKHEVREYSEKHYLPVKKDGNWEKGEIAFFGHHKVSFDEDGNYLRMKYFDDTDKFAGEVVPKRQDDKVIEESFYFRDGTLLNKTAIKHVSDNIQSYIVYDGQGKKTSEGKFLSKDSKITRQKFKELEGKEFKEYLTTFTYDNKGNITSRKQVDNDGKVISFTRYEYLLYDVRDNWVKKLEYSSEDASEPDKLIERTYEYY